MSLRHSLRSPGQFIQYSRHRVNFARRLREADFAMILPPWSRLRHDDTVVGELRREAIRAVWDSITPLPDRALIVIFSLLWPIRAAVMAIGLARRNGLAVRHASGIPPIRQWWEATTLAIVGNYAPLTYFQFRLFQTGRPPYAFIQTGEFMMLQVAETRGTDLGVINGKLRFYEECVRHGLPTVPIVAVFGRETERWIDSPSGHLPARSLFLKWQNGEQGQGYERWVYDSGSQTWKRHDNSLQHDGMLAYCRWVGATREVMVQPVIRNHPLIDQMNDGTLCTVRLMTYRNPDAPATLLRACFKVARAGTEVDNLHAGGYACAVDPRTGELGAAYGSHPSDGVHTHHPDSAAPIAGVYLPELESAIRLALTAHERLSVPWSVGWDVAITPEGPVLLEGNPMWGADLAQAPHGEPFAVDFLEQLLARVRR